MYILLEDAAWILLVSMVSAALFVVSVAVLTLKQVFGVLIHALRNIAERAFRPTPASLVPAERRQ
jgi:hypothetical protein